MKTFRVTLIRYDSVLMEAVDEAEARDCMKIRMGSAIANSDTHEIEVEEAVVSPKNAHLVLKP